MYIVDKTENNPLMVDGHPAWAASYDLASNTVTADSIRSNTFCAGGNQMGNGSWINIGECCSLSVDSNRREIALESIVRSIAITNRF